MTITNQTIIFRTKKNRFEDAQVSHETNCKTPVVSVGSFRGKTFTGKSFSARIEVWEELLPQLAKAVESLRRELAGEAEVEV